MTQAVSNVPTSLWRRPIVSGPFAALQAVVAGLLVCVILGLAGFFLSVAPGRPISGVARSVLAVWAASHGTGVDIGSIDIALTPMLVSVVLVLIIFGAARRAGRAASIFVAKGTVRRGSARDALIILATFTVAYTVIFTVSAPFAFSGQSVPDLARGVFAAFLMSSLCCIAGLLDSGRSVGAPGWYTILRQTANWEIAVALRAALHTLMALTLVAVAALGTALALTVPQQLALLKSLEADPLGVALMALSTLLFVPNLIVWTLAAISGPGFSFGTETSFGILGVQTQVMPSIPVLGALPQPGFGGGWWLLLALFPVAAGAMGALTVIRSAPSAPRLRHVAIAIVISSVVVGGAVAALTAMSSGGILRGSLSYIGANPWLCAGVVALETLVGGFLLLGVALAGKVGSLRHYLQGIAFQGRYRSRRSLISSSQDVDGGLDRVIGRDGELGSAERDLEEDLDEYFDDSDESELNLMHTTALTTAQRIVLDDVTPKSEKYRHKGGEPTRDENSIAGELLGMGTREMQQESKQRRFEMAKEEPEEPDETSRDSKPIRPQA